MKECCIIQNLSTGGKVLETECGWCMADALPKQSGNLGVPDAKSGLAGVRKNLSFRSEEWEEVSGRRWRVVQRDWLGCGGCVPGRGLAGGAGCTARASGGSLPSSYGVAALVFVWPAISLRSFG
jgi:hypothetical protein